MKPHLAVALLLVASLTGAHEARYQMQGESLPVAVRANGYEQSVKAIAPGEVEVRVKVTLDSIGSTGAYAAMGPRGMPVVPDGFVLPPRLASDIRGDGSAWLAATQVLEWTMKRVRLATQDGAPQDAVSVLERGFGRCSGVANAAAALLMAAGFDARTVSGVLMTDDGPVPHRWVECRLPGAGWVPSDPTLGLWAVTPRHVAFSSPVLELPTIRVIETTPDPLTALPSRHGRPIRPDRGAELVCRLVDSVSVGDVEAVLRGPAGVVRRALLAPEGRFTRLLPGRWVLEVEWRGEVVERRPLDLAAEDVHTFAVRLPQALEVGS